MCKRLLALFFSIFFAGSALAAVTPREAAPPAQVDAPAPESRKPFYQDKKRGWYWNEKMEEERKQKPKETSKPSETPRHPAPSLRDYSYDQLWNMHPDDFQELSNQILKKAVQYPTEENMYEYKLLADIARRKSAAFASAFGLATQKNPEFSVGDVYPYSQPGIIAKRDADKAMFEKAISQGKADFGLVVVTKQGCPFCEAEKDILSKFESRYGWPIREIDVSQGTGQAAFAAANDITTYPTLLVVYRETGQYMPVVTGATALDETMMKLYMAMRYLKGETTPEQFQMYDYQKGTGMDPLRKPKSFDKRGKGE